VTPKAPPKPAKVKAKVATAPRAVASASAKNSFYITTAIAYPNGAPHIGHAYEAIATDALARFQRLDGKDVFFLTGTDEHGQKMIQTAQKENMTPLELATRNAARFKEMDQRLNISFDLHPHVREAASRVNAGNLKRMARTAIFISTATPAGIPSATKPITRKTRPLSAKIMCAVGRKARGRVGRGEELLLQARLSGQAACALREPARFHRSGFAQERGRQLRQKRPEGSVDFAHHLRLGREGARRRRACDVRVGRCADQLHHRRRFPR
jgi:hypothetical protein